MIKVTDEAVDAACDVTWAGRQLTPRNARAVLEAAVPHLQVQAGGDGGLREALESQLGILSTAMLDNGYPTEVLPKAVLLDLLALHPAAPAVPQPVEACPSCHEERYRNGYCLDCGWRAAVPQPVDREAIEREIRRAATAMLCNSDIPGWTMQEELSKAADAVLALLSPEETK